MRLLLSLLLSFFSSVAFGQQIQVTNAPPFANTQAIGNGNDFFVSGPMFLGVGSVSTETLPIGLSYWVKVPSTISNIALLSFINNRILTGSTNGWLAYWRTNSPPYDLQFSTDTQTVSCANQSHTCIRGSYITDGNWHHVCQSFTATASIMYLDGVLWDKNIQASTYTPNSNYVTVGDNANGISNALRDVRWKSGGTFLAADCAKLYNEGTVGLAPNSSDPLSQNLLAWWPMNNCNSSGCADSSGNGRNLVLDNNPPTVVLTAPTGGTASGNMTVTATCTDPGGLPCASVAFIVDGYNGVNVTTSPFTSTFNTKRLVDGTHTVSAMGTTLGGATATTTTVTVTSSNSITGNTYYVTDNTGTNHCSDSNNGTTQSTPWCTIARVITGPTGGTSTYGPGDQILFGGGENWTISGTQLGLWLSSSVNSVGGSTSVANVGPTWGGANGAGTRNSVTVSVWNDGKGTSCNPIASTTSGCANFTNTQSAGPGTFPFFAPYAVAAANVHGVKFTNIRVLGSGTAPSPFTQAGIAAAASVASGVGIGEWYDNEITNVEVLETSDGIYLAGSGGALQGSLVSNSLSHGASVSSHMTVGIEQNTAVRNTVIEGNLVFDIGGYPTRGSGFGFAGCCGNGIFSTNGATNPTHQFNVIHDNGANNNDCGGPVGDFFFTTTFGVIQFDEVYNQIPVSLIAGSPCDNDGFDFDGSVTNAVMQYNYSHNTAGNGITGFTSQTWGPNVFRFNIVENAGLGVGDFSNGEIAMGPTDLNATYLVYNNTVFNNKNGVISYNGAPTRVTGITSSCVGSGIIANNIFMTNPTLGAAPFVFINPNCSTLFEANGYYATAAGGQWRIGTPSSFTTYASLPAWQAVIGSDTGAFNSNPIFSGTPPQGTCLTTPNGTGPQPCPAQYSLGVGSPALGTAYTGLTSAPWNQTITRDYYGNTCSGGNVRDIGASGCQ